MGLKDPGRCLAVAGSVRAVQLLLGLAAALFLVQALWIPAKAELAQLLLERSWNARLAGAQHAPPWPWADTQPVARLEIPAIALDLLVLNAPSNRSLAFGPVLAGAEGNDPVIFGHRDTHFRALRHLQIGDLLVLNDSGSPRQYRVSQIDIIDSRLQQLNTSAAINRLTLVTCYPFEALQANGPLRYVITAMPV